MDVNAPRTSDSYQHGCLPALRTMTPVTCISCPCFVIAGASFTNLLFYTYGDWNAIHTPFLHTHHTTFPFEASQPGPFQLHFPKSFQSVRLPAEVVTSHTSRNYEIDPSSDVTIKNTNTCEGRNEQNAMSSPCQ